MAESIIVTDFLPISLDKLPQLYAYKLSINNENQPQIGSKLAYRLRKMLGDGYWVWSNFRIVSNIRKSEEELTLILENLWNKEPQTFNHLHKITPDLEWQPGAREQADYVSRGRLNDDELSSKIRRELQKSRVDLDLAYVERDYEIRGWVVENEPAISISIASNLIYKKSLQSFVDEIDNLQDLIDIWVLVKTQNFKGRVIDILGELQNHRTRLIATVSSEEIKKFINQAPDRELVVKLQAGQHQYDYVLSALKVILTMESLAKFGIDSNKALKALQIAPQLRRQLVSKVTKVIKPDGIISYNSDTHPQLFLTAEEIGFVPKLRFGKDKILPVNETSILRNIEGAGLYKISDKFKENPIAIGLIDGRSQRQPTRFKQDLIEKLQRIGFDLKFVGTQQVSEFVRAELEAAINSLKAEKPDLILALLPDSVINDELVYQRLKSLTVGDNLPSQLLGESTLSNSYAVGNVVLGILGKTGNIPFVLAEPLPFADLIVGIDVAREKKRKLSGSLNATAIARIYLNNGDLLKYAIHDGPVEGETIPEQVLESLFPRSQFSGKRVVIHRDGYFRGNEKRILSAWAESLAAEFYFVEILKSGAPRLYREVNQEIRQPLKGDIFKISEVEAFLVSSPPPFKAATPQPLQIRTDDSFNINDALQSVLALTLLHYGSIRPPRLPVSIHYSDKIGYLALRGIKPKNLEGNLPFWL